MKAAVQKVIQIEDVLTGYDAVSRLYPFIPSVSLWRSWEYTAYMRHSLREPVLDVGCGDGSFFRLVWPGLQDVCGLDSDPFIVKAAASSGIYREVHAASASAMPFEKERFSSVFANCSLEHMDDLEKVLGSVWRVLKDGGTFLMSVVTEKFIEWLPLPPILRTMATGLDATVRDGFVSYHHLVNALPEHCWTEKLAHAGFEVTECIPILPEFTGRMFLFIDNLWHLKNVQEEVGYRLGQYLAEFPSFPTAFREILKGALLAERDWQTGCGLVICARKKGTGGGV